LYLSKYFSEWKMHGTRAIAQGETRVIVTSEKTYYLCCTPCPCVMVAEINMAMLADVPKLLFFVFIS
jgi:hypothetical protein